MAWLLLKKSAIGPPFRYPERYERCSGWVEMEAPVVYSRSSDTTVYTVSPDYGRPDTLVRVLGSQTWQRPLIEPVRPQRQPDPGFQRRPATQAGRDSPRPQYRDREPGAWCSALLRGGRPADGSAALLLIEVPVSRTARGRSTGTTRWEDESSPARGVSRAPPTMQLSRARCA